VQRTLLLALLVFMIPQTLIRAYRYAVRLSSVHALLLLAVTLLALPIYATAVYLKTTADFFRLEPLEWSDWALVIAVLIPTMIALTVLDWIVIQRAKLR
jgi:hypothetical protein